MLATKIVRLGSAIALFVQVFACMYNPKPESGTQECFQKRCVDGYVCGYNNMCYTPDKVPVAPGTGGDGTGGLHGTGGVIAPGTGGSGSGGVKGTGGTTSSGGKGGSGGGMGGGMGGSAGSGGVSVSGGISGTGGVTSVGGVSGSGGTSSTGGTTTPPNSGTVMTIANGQAQGAMTGFGWVAFGPLDSVTDPTCKSPAGQMVSGTPCDDTIWSTPSAYCVTGYIPAVPSAPTTTDWNNNWGIQIGIGATPVSGGVLGQTFSGMTVSMTGSPLAGLRAQVHRRGDPDTTSYCATFTSGTAVPFNRFSTVCYDTANPGTVLAASDVPNVDKVSVQVPSTIGSAITVTKLCLVGITFVP
jgi:hypothetical protein